MSVAAQARQPLVDAIPETIESPKAKLIYLSLATAGRSTVDDLAERLGMQKLALFSVLATLEQRSLVASDGGVYRTV